MIIEKCVTSSTFWQQHIQVFHLTKNMRLRDENDKLFNDYLLKLGSGHPDLIKSEEPLKGLTYLPPSCITDQNLVSEIFPSDSYDESVFSSRAILCPTNEITFDVNSRVLEIVPGEEREYLSVDRIEDKEDGQMDDASRDGIPLEHLHSLTPSGMPRHKIVLKVGAVVMLLRNMDKNRGLTNGTRLIVRHLSDHILQCDVITGKNKGERVFIPRTTLKPSETNLPFILVRRQVPIRVAQGQTFEKLGIYLPTTCFSHGQLYVAFSRARALEDIRVSLPFIPDEQGAVERGGTKYFYTKNVVFTQVLPPPPPVLTQEEEIDLGIYAHDIIGDEHLMEELLDMSL